MNREQKFKKIGGLMRGIWSSLDSHLQWVDAVPKGKKGCKRCEGFGTDKFHRQAVRDYAKQLKDLADLL